MNINYIDLVLENCDVIRLEHKDINYFYIGGITETYTSQTTLKGIYYTDRTKHCSHLGLLINNPKELTFDSLDGEITVYERVENFHDITAIDIIYEDKTHEYIYVDWNDYNDNYNLNQKTDYYYNILEVTIGKENAEGFTEEPPNETYNETTMSIQPTLQEKKAKAFDEIVDNCYYQLKSYNELDRIECNTLLEIIEESFE